MKAAAFALLSFGIHLRIANSHDDYCEPKSGVVPCYVDRITNRSLNQLPSNCTTFLGDLILEDMTALPSQITKLSKLSHIKGALIIRNTNFDMADFSFLNSVRCIENRHGPAIILERNANLSTLGLKKVEFIAADGEPVFSMSDDSYLNLVEDAELGKLVIAASIDGHYHDGLFSVIEENGSYENIIFYATFLATSAIVIVIVLVGHFVFKLHVPKKNESKRNPPIQEPSTSGRTSTNASCSIKQIAQPRRRVTTSTRSNIPVI